MYSFKNQETNAVKSRRIPNAFMLFVKENKKNFLQNCEGEDRSDIAALLGKKWKSMTNEEKQVYYDKYNALKKLKDDKLDADSDTEEKLTDEEVFSMDIHKNEGDVTDEHETSKFTIKSTAAELDVGSMKKCKTNSSSLTDIDDLSLTEKQKSFKKVRRPPNAFMLFANEKRCSLDPAITKDKKCHSNSILGNMWRELPDSEKAKYLSEARRLMNVHKKSTSPLPSKVLKKKRKVHFKLPKKSAGRPNKKKEYRPKTSPSLQRSDVGDLKRISESNSNKSVGDKSENIASSRPSPELHVSNEHSNSCPQQQHNIPKNQLQRMSPSPGESHHSKHCCCRSASNHDYNSNDNCKQFDAGVPKSCFGAACFPSMFPSYNPFSAPFWMYQQAMAQPMFPFQSLGFPPSLCSCSSSYFYNSAYLNSYSSLYAEKVMGPMSYGSHSSASASATSSSVKEKSPEVTKTDESFDDEELIVDEGSSDDEQKEESESVEI